MGRRRCCWVEGPSSPGHRLASSSSLQRPLPGTRQVAEGERASEGRWRKRDGRQRQEGTEGASLLTPLSLFFKKLVVELKEQNTLLKKEKEELNRRIQDQAREITGTLLSSQAGCIY